MDPNIREAIDSYQEAWRPPEGELPRVVVIIDPAPAPFQPAHCVEDLALITAHRLYHLVHLGGGTPVMTRTDEDHRGLECASRMYAPGSGDFVLRIECTDRDGHEVLALRDDAISRSLVAFLNLALNSATADHRARPAAADSAGTPGATVRLARRRAAAGRPALPDECRWAEAVYQAIAAAVRQLPAEPATDRAARDAPPVTKDTSAVPFLPNESWPEEVAHNARRVWPAGDLPIELAPWFCGALLRAAASDRSFIYVRADVRRDDDLVIVDGATNVAAMGTLLGDALRSVGVERLQCTMRQLPEEGDLPGTRFGVCIAPTALTYDSPCEASGLRSQLVYGENVWLLDRAPGFCLVHGGDGYWGWVREEAISPVPATEFRQRSDARQAVLLRDFTHADLRIVQGARMPATIDADGEILLWLPGGRTVQARREDVDLDADAHAESRATKALALLHRPYVYGGVSPVGLDCSGLVRLVCGQNGVPVARDAAQQFQHGRMVATRWCREGIRCGDLLFFAGDTGRVYHVGIALSATHFVHCAPPGVGINSLSHGDRLYSEYRDRTFLAARRLT